MPENQLPPEITQEVKALADTIRARFTPPEFIPGCQVVDITDINQYTTGNGWIEAICGQHNQQRVRYKGFPSGVGTASYVDVLFFQDRRLFECYGSGGTVAPGTGTGWPFPNIITVGANGDYTTLQDAIDSVAAGGTGVIYADRATYTENLTISGKDITIKGQGNDPSLVMTYGTDPLVVIDGTVTLESDGTNNCLFTAIDCGFTAAISGDNSVSGGNIKFFARGAYLYLPALSIDLAGSADVTLLYSTVRHVSGPGNNAISVDNSAGGSFTAIECDLGDITFVNANTTYYLTNTIYGAITGGTLGRSDLIGGLDVGDVSSVAAHQVLTWDGSQAIFVTGLDLNGAADALILDADGDTTLSAPTDDEIDIEVGGADIAEFKSGGLYLPSTKDIYPNGRTYGLNSRFEKLFGADCPAHSYQYTRRTFQTNDFANNKAGFEDSTAVSSPFSIVTPASSYTASYTDSPHWLTLRNWHATDWLYLQWTSATAKNYVDVIWAAVVNETVMSTSDVMVAEFRFWGVQSPGASDKYFAVRIRGLASTAPQHPAAIEYWYGTGVTFNSAGTDGTLANRRPCVFGQAYQSKFDIVATSTFAQGVINLSEGFGTGGAAVQQTGWSSSVKTAQFRVTPASFAYLWLDQVVIT